MEYIAKYTFVQTETPEELIHYLKHIGYKADYRYDLSDEDYDTICIHEGTFYPCLYEDVYKDLSDPKWMDCTVFPYVFNIIARIQKDTDINQYYIHKSLAHLWLVDPEMITFEHDYNASNDDPELKLEDWHKASQEEIYNYHMRIYKLAKHL